MLVEIVHFRDPDSECDVHVFVDGVKIPQEQTTYVDLDPGRGYSREDWDEHRRYSMENLTPDASALASVLFDAADESKYIGG